MRLHLILKAGVIMTCTFCGSTLDDDQVECPYCGHKTGLEQNPAYREAAYGDPEADGEFEDDYDEFEEINPDEDLDYGEEEEYDEDSNPGKPGLNLPKLNLNRKKDSRTAQGRETTMNSAKEVLGSAGAKAAAAFSGLKNLISSKKSDGQKQSTGKRSNPMMVFLAILAACVLLSVISLISTISTGNKLNEMNQNLLSQMYQLQNNYQKLSDRIDDLGSSVTTVSTTLASSETGKTITITKEPTSASTYLGRGGDQDSTQNVPVFSVSATGINVSFKWQRKDETTNSWVDLVFDAESNNEQYGLHVYNDPSKGYSELAAHGITEAAYGTYRCNVIDDYGSKTTDTVMLTKRAA